MAMLPPPRNARLLQRLRLLLLLLSSATSVYQMASAQVVRGERDFIPNGSFEQLAFTHQQDYVNGTLIWPFWRPRYAYASAWWRQFHRQFKTNSAKPPALIQYFEDRTPYVYLVTGRVPIDDYYDPVSCSTTDLFTIEQESCDRGIGKPLFGIPENWFGYQPARERADAVNRRYAGLYYRLNGVKALEGGGSISIPLKEVQNAATDLWREYLEVELVCPLEKGKQYTLSYYASLAEVSNKALRLEARISPEPYLTVPVDVCGPIPDDDGPDAKVGIPYTASTKELRFQSGYVDDKNEWTKLEYRFTANGEEKFLTIGNFEQKPDVRNPIAPQPPDCVPAYSNSNATEIAYYYIDDVRLSQSIDCFCKDNDQAFRAKLVTKVSQDPTQCCYTLYLSNGGIGSPQFDCLYSACSIYGVDLLKPDGSGAASDVLFTWSSSDPARLNPMKEPITADNKYYELGTICVTAFSNTESRELVVAIKGQDGTTLCKQRIPYDGCQDNESCTCSDFANSVLVKPVEPYDRCCFEVSADASKLKGGCQIRSIDIYSDSKLTSKITRTFTPDTPVDKTFSGPLFTFCLDRTNPNSNGRREVVFRDASGEIICRKSVDLTCECDCFNRPPRLQIDFTSAGMRDGKCCYQIKLNEVTTCPVTVMTLGIDTDETLEIQPRDGWTLDRQYGRVTLYPKNSDLKQLYDIGLFCVSPCMAFDPKALNITAKLALKVGDALTECKVPVTVNQDKLEKCRGTKSCDDVVLSVVGNYRPGTPQVDDCCRKVRVQIRGCTLTNSSLALDIKGPNGTPLKTTNLGGGMFESASLCRTYFPGDTFTVVVRDIRGNLICTKKIPVASCTLRETNQ